MGRVTAWWIVAPLAALPVPAPAAPVDIGNALAWVELRPRYNFIDESDRPKDATGGTMRAVAGVRFAPAAGWRATAELIHAEHLGPKRFNDDGAQFATSEYPLLPDPRHTGLNQAHVEYDGIDGWLVRAGRQRVNLDNRRWVSDNDFRQIPQLFDGVTLAWSGLPGTLFTAGRYWRIRSTSGERNEARLTVAHAAWNPAPGHAVSAFGYFHEQPRTSNFTGFADNSYRVVGARAEGVAFRLGGLDVPYLVEAAQQRAYAGGDARIDARYWRAGAGLATAQWTLRADQEVRGSNGGAYGLQIPLTDFYSFNGWTLHWFTVPREGLRDRWLTGRWALGPVTLHAELHRFRSDVRGLDFGRESNTSVAWEILPNATVRLQHARYDPGSGRPDDPTIRKVWLTLGWSYP